MASRGLLSCFLVMTCTALLSIVTSFLLYSRGFPRSTFREFTFREISEKRHDINIVHVSPGQLKCTSKQAPKLGYVLTLSFGHVDQQTVAACAMFSQQCWLKSFHLRMSIVEPFVVKSHLESPPKYWTMIRSNKYVLRFSDHFDLDHLHSVNVSKKFPNLTRWECFIENAPRSIVAVTIQDLNAERDNCFARIGKPQQACRCGPRNEEEIRRFTSGCNTSEIDSAVSYLKENHGFELLKHVCLNCGRGMPSTGYSPTDINALIFDGVKDHKNVTILINQWIYSIDLVRDCKYKKYCSDCVSFNSSEYNKLKPSRRIEADAIDYRNNVLNVSSISVAVMIRAERMFRKYKSLKKVLNCLNSIVDKYEELSKKYEFTNSMPLLTIDVGRFGTDMKCPYCSHDEEVKAKFESLLSHFYRGNWTFERYEKGLSEAAKGVNDGGYIAGLQRVLSSRARCLLLYGAGHYQALAEHHYKVNHPTRDEQCIHYVTDCGGS